MLLVMLTAEMGPCPLVGGTGVRVSVCLAPLQTLALQ